MKIRYRLLPLIVAALLSTTSSYADDLELQRQSMAKQLGVDKAKIDSLENKFKLRLFFACSDGQCKEVQSFCADLPYPNICVMKSFYIYKMMNEICEGSNDCIDRQEKDKIKYESFVIKHAMKAGIGRMAVNICSPLHEFDSAEQNVRDNGDELKGIHAVTQFYDYSSLFKCVSDTYKEIALRNIK